MKKPDKSFWSENEIKEKGKLKSVHLRLDSEVFEFFKSEGKGHITKMQNILLAYVKAHK